jgi:hypothetical protein
VYLSGVNGSAADVEGGCWWVFLAINVIQPYSTVKARSKKKRMSWMETKGLNSRLRGVKVVSIFEASNVQNLWAKFGGFAVRVTGVAFRSLEKSRERRSGKSTFRRLSVRVRG